MSQPPSRRVTDALLDVLDELLRHPAGAHGYEIARTRVMQRPTVYLVLARLERWGWTERTLEESAVLGRAPRHVHQLTDDGRAKARGLLDTHRPAVVAA